MRCWQPFLRAGEKKKPLEPRRSPPFVSFFLSRMFIIRGGPEKIKQIPGGGGTSGDNIKGHPTRPNPAIEPPLTMEAGCIATIPCGNHKSAGGSTNAIAVKEAPVSLHFRKLQGQRWSSICRSLSLTTNEANGWLVVTGQLAWRLGGNRSISANRLLLLLLLLLVLLLSDRCYGDGVGARLSLD